MSIGAEHFGSNGTTFATFDVHATAATEAHVYSIQCHSCGFEATEQLLAGDVRCPKCNSRRLERVPVPRSLLFPQMQGAEPSAKD